MPRHVPEKKDAFERRNAPGSCRRARIRRCPNGKTRIPQWGCIPKGRREPGEVKHLKYPEEKRTKVIPGVAASETGGSRNQPTGWGSRTAEEEREAQRNRHGAAGQEGEYRRSAKRGRGANGILIRRGTRNPAGRAARDHPASLNTST